MKRLFAWARRPWAALLLWVPLGVWAALGSPGRALRDPSAAGSWEDLFLWALLALFVLLGAGLRWWGEARPEPAARRAWPPWVVPLALGLGWTATWIALHAARDPGWVPSGIDWQDSFLDAYAIRYDDPSFYCFWRYPLYPWLGATLARCTGLELDVALQVVSRASLVLLAVPLWSLGVRLGSRVAAATGVALLFALPSVHMLSDAVTPYPLVALVAVTAAACGERAAAGSWPGFFGLGVAAAGIFTSEAKGLALGLGILGAGILAALVAPGRGGPAGWGRRIARGAGRASLRLALVIAPTVVGYGWMNAQPFVPVSLEEHAIHSLVHPEADEATRRAVFAHPYIFGHFEDAGTVPRTLRTFWRAARDPTLAEARANWRQDSHRRIALDFPGMTARLPLVALCGLLVPLLAPPPGRRRLGVAVGLLPLLAVLASCVPVVSNYQERYLVHGLVLLPLLLAVLLDGAARLLLRGTGRRGAGLRAVSLAALVLAVLLGPSPLALRDLAPRIVPVTLGGRMEVEARAWAREHLAAGDLLLDTTWLMSGLLLAGHHPVARPDSTYPPGGAPSPADHWRITKPWPARFDGAYYALAVFIDPQDFATREVAGTLPPGANAMTPQDPARLEPDSPAGRAVVGREGWEEVFRDEGGRLRIYRWARPGVPPGWRLPAALRPGR